MAQRERGECSRRLIVGGESSQQASSVRRCLAAGEWRFCDGVMGGGSVSWPKVVEKEVQTVGAVVICGRWPEDGGFGRWGSWTQARFCISDQWRKRDSKERRRNFGKDKTEEEKSV